MAEHSSQVLPEIRWENIGLDQLAPAWTSEPDITIIKRLAAVHLNIPPDSPVTFFVSGAFNRLYAVGPSHLMRVLVTLPVIPFYKTASEVATLAYLSRHTSTPVPRVVGHCSSTTKNELGFE